MVGAGAGRAGKPVGSRRRRDGHSGRHWRVGRGPRQPHDQPAREDGRLLWGVGGRGGSVVLWTRTGSLAYLPAGARQTRTVGGYQAILAAGTGARRPVALVQSAPSRFEIVNAESGRVLAAASTPGGQAPGTLAPGEQPAIDRRHADRNRRLHAPQRPRATVVAKITPGVGLEPTTYRLTADDSAN